MTARRLQVRYAVALGFAQVMAAGEVTAIVLPLRGETVASAATVFSTRTLVAFIVLMVPAVVAAVAYALVTVSSSLRWFTSGEKPSARQRRSARNLARNQSAMVMATWAVAGVVLTAINSQGGVQAALLIATLTLFGATTSSGAALLFAQRTVRPVVAAATAGSTGRDTTPGVLARLLLMWLMVSALPTLGIAVLVLMRSSGWIIAKSGSIEIPILVLSLVSMLVGLRGMMVVSLSISDPVHEVVDAMAQVGHGRIDTTVSVYERSEIGRLQAGFNRMVAGLAERDRLRDLFGRHVGADVARRAASETGSSDGEVREAAVLFVDLVGSTRLAQTHSPAEVAEVLNHFFQIVVAAVDERHGLINKFQGDAVLAVFGAPLLNDRAASDALTTVRALQAALRRLPLVDFGIGVSAGPVFAGNIGAEHRYEYTVIGDAVNEAARLADRAKTTPERALCSSSALAHADDAERAHWAPHASEVLRGRLTATQISAPAPSA